MKRRKTESRSIDFVSNKPLLLKEYSNILKIRDQGARILVKRVIGLGDVVLTIPPLIALKRWYGNAYIIYVTSDVFVPIFTRLNLVDLVIDLDTYKKGKISFDVIADLDGKVDHLPVSQKAHRADLLAMAMGISLSLDDKKYRIKANSVDITWIKDYLKSNGYRGGHIVGIQFDACSDIRTWPSDYIRRLVDNLRNKGITTIILGRDPIDIDGLGSINLCGKLSIERLFATVSLCNAVVGSDSGILHVAGILGIPIVGIFGSIEPLFRVRYYDSYIVLINKGLPCVPCWDWQLHSCRQTPFYKKCLTSIYPDDVSGAVDDILENPALQKIVRLNRD